jgi:hypothetical protein
LLEHAPLRQQVPEKGIGASPAEDLPYFVEISRQELAGKIERELVAEIELSLVRYRQVFSSSSMSSGSSSFGSFSSSSSDNSERR